MYGANENMTSGKVWKGDVEELGIGINSDLYITFPRGQKNNLTTEFDLSDQYIAPLNKGDVQGNLKISLAENEVAEAKLIALQSVNEGSIIVRLKDSFRLLLE